MKNSCAILTKGSLPKEFLPKTLHQRIPIKMLIASWSAILFIMFVFRFAVETSRFSTVCTNLRPIRQVHLLNLKSWNSLTLPLLVRHLDSKHLGSKRFAFLSLSTRDRVRETCDRERECSRLIGSVADFQMFSNVHCLHFGMLKRSNWNFESENFLEFTNCEKQSD